MKKILIVEDDQIVANIYRNKFSVDGFQVEVALDGQVGLEMVRSFRPDAVILDLMKKIRLEQDCQHLPVIVFSNTYLSNMVQEAWKAGATKCLSKANCTPKQVIEIVRTELSGNGKTAGSSPTPAVAQAAAGNHAQPSATLADAKFQGDLQKSFVQGLPATLSALRV